LEVSRLPAEFQLGELSLNRGQPSFPLAPILAAQQRGDAVDGLRVDVNR
jgi:hypothetical protein